jgi:hypothetical protein
MNVLRGRRALRQTKKSMVMDILSTIHMELNPCRPGKGGPTRARLYPANQGLQLGGHPLGRFAFRTRRLNFMNEAYSTFLTKLADRKAGLDRQKREHLLSEIAREHSVHIDTAAVSAFAKQASSGIEHLHYRPTSQHVRTATPDLIVVVRLLRARIASKFRPYTLSD